MLRKNLINKIPKKTNLHSVANNITALCTFEDDSAAGDEKADLEFGLFVLFYML